MTKFRIVSDIHLEHHLGNTPDIGRVKVQMDKVLPTMPDDSETCLILAGDISSYWDQRRVMLASVANRFKQVIYVAGNHEHWGSRLDDWNKGIPLLEKPFQNVHISLANEARKTFVENFDIVFATMWAPYGKYDPSYEVQLMYNMDCKRIDRDTIQGRPRDCRPKDFQDMFTAEIKDIKIELQESFNVGRESVVVTHHVPSAKLRMPGCDADAWDDMFIAPEAEAFMHEDWAPKFWFFGHTHKSWDIQIGNTRCISNPYGYPGESYRGWVSAKIA